MRKELYIIFKVYNIVKREYSVFFDKVRADYNLLNIVMELHDMGYHIEYIEPHFDKKIFSSRLHTLRDEAEKTNAELPF